MRQLICVTLASAMCFLSAALQAGAPKTQEFRDYVGSCQGRVSDELWDRSIAWGRWDLSWGTLEPEQGQWHQERLEQWAQKITEAQARQAKVLPILDYNAGWSIDRSDRSYEYGQRRIEYRQLPDGQFERIVTPLNPNDKTPPSRKTVRAGGQFPLAAEHVKDWENYVRRVVSTLRKPPYNVEYFQIWNEAHPESGFWQGSLDDYATRVHIPAAKVIHELGGKVVYGGWPCCGSLGEYVSLLDQHQLWPTIDALDVHYFPMSSFEYLRKAAEKRGFPDIGIWQTEVAFTKDPSYVSNSYPRFLAWALEHQTRLDQYKMFFFPHFAPGDEKAYGYLRGLWSGKELSLHGKSLKTLGDLLAGENLRIYKDFKVEPVLKEEEDERLSGAEAFRVGNRIVVAIHMAQNNDADIFVDWNGDGDAMHLSEGTPTVTVVLPKVAMNQVRRAERVSAVGSRMALRPEAMAGGLPGIRVVVPIRESTKEEAQIWTEKSKQARTMYVVVEE